MPRHEKRLRSVETKEMELARLEKEVEALRLVAALLSEDKEGTDPAKNGFGMGTAQQPIRIPQAAVAATASPGTNRSCCGLGRNRQAMALNCSG